MEKTAVRRMFPGNNTGIGFYSYYKYIMPQEQANHIFCLKGGPGVGKSTFMRHIGERVQEMGMDIEYMHCSSDPDSLDGIAVPKLGAAVVDGTAPHITDPINPGAVDEIVNLGEYWDISAIRKNKSKIMQANAETGTLFVRAYKYLNAAKSVLEALNEIYDTNTDISGYYTESEAIIEKELKHKNQRKAGKERKMFASAITPKGLVDHLDTLFDNSFKVYALPCEWGTGVSKLLARISEEALLEGFDTERFYSPMLPQSKIEHVMIPELKLAFITINRHLKTGHLQDVIIDLNRYVAQDKIDLYKEEVKTDIENYEALTGQAFLTLRKAKRKHDELETYYVPYMDFDKINKKADEVFTAIRSYERS